MGPLAGSNTYEPKPFGIDKATEERLVKDHFLFQEPDEPMLLSWRMERDWPQARGIYHNNAKTALVWSMKRTTSASSACRRARTSARCSTALVLWCRPLRTRARQLA